jgi:hypothetical protein
MKKQTLFSKESIITSLKAFVVSIVTSLIFVIPMGIGFWLRNVSVVVSWLFYLITLVGELFFWGWLANKFWKWK